MKVSSLFFAGVTAVSATALPQLEIRDAPPVAAAPEINFDTVPGLAFTYPQLYPFLFDSNGKLQAVTDNGNHPLPKSEVSVVQDETPKFFKDGAIRKKIRYGPFRLPGVKETNWQSKFMNMGGMADVYLPNIQKPCEECMLAAANVDVEFADGKPTGSVTWLHHSAMTISGPKIRDPICNGSSTEAFFSSGNERTVAFFRPKDESAVKAGFRVTKDDGLYLVAEFKNEQEEPQWVWLSVAYEFYDGPRPDFKDSHVAGITLGQPGKVVGCMPKENPFGASNLTATGAPKTQVFSEATKPWTTPFDFTLVSFGAHLHDGGISIDFYQNDKRICEAVAEYAEGVPAGMMSHGKGEHKPDEQSLGVHIKSISSCQLMLPAKAGDKFYLRANYDLTKHAGQRLYDGSLDEVMGVGSMLMITEPKK